MADGQGELMPVPFDHKYSVMSVVILGLWKSSAKKISAALWVIMCHCGIGVSWYLSGVSQVSPGVF